MKPLSQTEVHVVRTLDDALACKRWLSERHGTETLAFDTETGGLESWKQPLRLVQFGDCDQAWVVPWEGWAGLAKEVLRDWQGSWVGYNTMFEVRFLEANGAEVPRARLHDCAVLAHLQDSSRRNALKPLSVSLLDKQAAAGQELLTRGMADQKWTWATVPLDFAPYTFYAGFDAILTARLWEGPFAPVREAYREAYELEMAAAQICSDMSVRGMRIDIEYTNRQELLVGDWLDEMRVWFKEQWGVSPGSSAELATRFLADGVRLEKKTKGGAWSMDKDALDGIGHPLAAAVRKYRAGVNVHNYFKGILRNLDGDLIHCDINPLGARTSRKSVSNPPFQQLPSKSPLVRDCVIYREGNRGVLCDLDQIEVRILADRANEERLIAGIRAGEDPHWVSARAMYGPNATKDDRKKSKTGTFGELYGIGIAKFAVQQGVSEDEARAFKAQYHAAHPGVSKFVRDVEAIARQRMKDEGTPYIVLRDGRRLPLDKDKLYTGVNYICQGNAAMLFKQAMVRMDAAGVGEYLTIPVHDEIQADVPADIAEEVSRTIQECMTDTTTWAVPITADVQIVDRWGDPYREPAA